MGMPITPLCLSSPQYFSYLKIPVDCLKIRCIAAKAQSVAAIYRFSKPSEKEKQIPFNMEMDINRLCLERELETFIDSGVAEDAYNVYYC